MTGSQGQFWLNTVKNIRGDIDGTGLGMPTAERNSEPPRDRTPLERFDETITNGSLSEVCRRLFVDGHYAQAVEQAFKSLNNAVRAKSGLNNVDGEPLMQQAFSPNKPILRLNRMRTTTDVNEQRGYMNLFAGAMTAIRNPRAHEHSIQDDPETALELLTIGNHLMDMLDASTKTRHRKTRT